MQVKHITKKKFFEKFDGLNFDLAKTGLFNEQDLEELRIFESSYSIAYKFKLFFHYIPFIIKNPAFLKTFIFPRILSLIFNPKKSRQPIHENQLVATCSLKTSLISPFKPKRILEIGTYLGCGAASFAFAFPKSIVFTMCPRINAYANNPIDDSYIGSYFRKKRLKNVKQIWADSTKYDYNKLSFVDVSYIDGNHSYEYVLNDLEKTSRITTRCILLDDYIPKNVEKMKGLVYGPWNEGVVNATHDFLLKNPDVFNNAYWIIDTKYCLLIKK